MLYYQTSWIASYIPSFFFLCTSPPFSVCVCVHSEKGTAEKGELIQQLYYCRDYTDLINDTPQTRIDFGTHSSLSGY